MRKYGLLKLFYFIFSMATGAFQFLNLFYADFGLDTQEIGMLFAVGPMVMIVAQPFWGMITDYMNSAKLTLSLMSIGSAATILFFPISTQFEHLLWLNILFFFFQSAIPPIADVTSMTMLESRKEFGKIRLWGSVGYAVGVLVVGRLLDIFGLDLMFILYSVLIVAALFLAMKLPVKPAAKKEFHMREVLALFTNPQFALFLLFSFMVHLTVHANNSFYSIHMQDLGASISLIGIALLIKSILEVPFFSLSRQLMNAFSYPMLLTAVAFVYGLRWLILGVSTNVDILLWSQLLLALSFSIQYFVAVAYVDELTPENYRATGQTIFWAVSLGAAGVIGNVLAGWVLNFVTIEQMYQLAAAVSFISIAILWLKPRKHAAENG
ncbi:MFS transporter [Gracilibacillus alcaliphilus]|uniref:MFS transporter n=1 Tax=Gracilibacillus alcaliphilus TaxID=1401441 RepID=UPI00195A6B50|nr:MFS transporter [Gracilibacillus alcaliphilus]MBM7677451.1 MFS family permease [Gracilibacillus alcaliphilus]